MASSVDNLSVKQLRELITSAGLSYVDCVEKPELRARAVEASALLAAKDGAPASTPEGKASSGAAAREDGEAQSEKTMTLSGYDCVVKGPAHCLDGTVQPDLVIIILHGFGATNGDFSSLPSSSGRLVAAKKVVWVFPQAPLGDLGMSAWWKIDPMKWMSAAMAGGDGLAKLIREEPPGLAECRSRMLKLIDEVEAMAGGVPTSRLVLGGFSQGAITAMDLALQLPKDRRVAGVTVLSGAPVVIDQWAPRLKEHSGLKVFVTHGSADMVLPFAASGWLKQLLEAGGASVQYEVHQGGHGLAPDTIPKLVAFWSSL